MKKGYNATTPVADAIREHIKEVAKPYKWFTQKAREVDLAPYSKDWETRKPEQKRDLIKRSAFVDRNMTMDDVIEEAPQLATQVEALVNRPFEPRRFIEWDHEKQQEAPRAVPALVESLSKQRTNNVIMRDKFLKDEAQVDPVHAVTELLSNFVQHEDQETAAGTHETAGGSRAKEDPLVALPPVSVRRSVVRKLVAKAGTTNRKEALVEAIMAFVADVDEQEEVLDQDIA